MRNVRLWSRNCNDELPLRATASLHTQSCRDNHHADKPNCSQCSIRLCLLDTKQVSQEFCQRPCGLAIPPFFFRSDLQNITAKASLIPLLFAPFFGVFDFSAIKFILSSGFDDDEDSPVPLVAFLLISVGLDTFFVLLGFNTSNESTTIAYLTMIFGSLIALLFLKVFLGASEDEEPLAFDKNPGWNGILLALFLGFVVLIINVAVVSFASLSFVPSGLGSLQGINYNSLLFVPKFFSVAQAGQQSILDNAVFQLILTAPGEEGLKAAMLYGMYIVTKSEAVSVGFSTAIWASFHTILVGFTLPEVVLAFVSGLIWYGGWNYTGTLGPYNITWSVQRLYRCALGSPLTFFILNLIECKGRSSWTCHCYSRPIHFSERNNPRLSSATEGAVDCGLQCQHRAGGLGSKFVCCRNGLGYCPNCEFLPECCSS